MSVEKHTLDNGATVLIDHMPNSQTTAMSYTFRVGSRFETAEENGLAHFFEHMAFKGTKNRDVTALNKEMDDLGARSNAFTSKEVTSYHMHGLNEDVFKFNEIEADMAMNLTLPADELEKERGVILEEIKRSEDNNSSVLINAVFDTLYSGQAMGRTVLGPSENIKSFDRDMFDAFRAKHYHAGNLIVSVAGGCDPAKILQDIKDKVADMPTGERSIFDPAQYVGGNCEIVKPTQQVSLAVAFEAASTNDPKDEIAESILSKVLSGGMSSRLFTEIREKRSLVYGVAAGFSHSLDTGLFIAQAGTSPEKVSQLIHVLCDELNKLRQDPISDEEFNRAKKLFRSHIAMEADASSASRMTSNMMEFNMHQSIETVEDFMARVDSVTKDDVMEAARRVFSTKPSYVSVGPEKPNESEQIAMRMGFEL